MLYFDTFLITTTFFDELESMGTYYDGVYKLIHISSKNVFYQIFISISYYDAIEWSRRIRDAIMINL